jgi:hypothetical protein
LTDQTAVDYRQDLEIAELEDYLEDFWWLVHHSGDDDDTVLLGLTSFLDDSISRDRAALAITTIGGPAMSRISFKALGREWLPMLHEYRIRAPLHMQDFVRPNGRHIGMPFVMKLSLFRDVVAIINRHKLYSFSISIPQEHFDELIPEYASKDILSPYALAFCCAVLMNQGIGQRKDHQSRVAYLIDKGCAHPDHLQNVHSLIQDLEKQRDGFRYTGAIAFDRDDNHPALQAADVIAWAARRREVYGALTDEYAPLGDVLLPAPHKPPHGHVPVPKEGIEMWASRIRNWLQYKGRLPDLNEFVV